MMELTTYKGIDYGHGKANIDIDTNIRYGVIPQNHVLQAWADSSEPYYGGDEETAEWSEEDWDYAEPLSFLIDDGEYQAQSDDNGDVMVFKSPFFTYAQFCSPCAPGACYLTNPVEPDLNNKTYCFGPDWFEGEPPYPIYSVETGKPIEVQQ